MKIFVTFGQDHRHEINGKTFDKDCVAVIHAANPVEGRMKVFDTFGVKFCFEYPEAFWDHNKMMKYYPRGYINVN